MSKPKIVLALTLFQEHNASEIGYIMAAAHLVAKSEPPPTYEVLKDTARLIETRMPRHDAKTFIKSLNPRRIELYTLGIFVDPPMDNDELFFAAKVNRCEQDFGSHSLGLVALIEQLQVEVQEGRVFVDEPIISSPQIK